MNINFNERHLRCFAKNSIFFRFWLKPMEFLNKKRAKARSY
jgi:hypothetical protein